MIILNKIYMYDWKDLLKEKKTKIIKIVRKINNLRSFEKIFPKKKDVFKAFNLTKFNNIKVVILGQDPYFKKKQAHGLAFSVKSGTVFPPSLKNIFKEIKTDINDKIKFKSGCLEKWSSQGVFLLNSILTVSLNRPRSHVKFGWEEITDYVISLINFYHSGVIFLLWGSYAQKKRSLIDIKKNYVLCTSHPSPFSVYKGFFGCKHFSEVNRLLELHKQKIIDWSID
ncbi:MAG: uracil-DNA glycosylase [Buchnera aphidicola (Periphyllus aceris)]|nr:uracil-DNA glycosylase [Buchnera aphidicola (Periphyllus aceris)]